MTYFFRLYCGLHHLFLLFTHLCAIITSVIFMTSKVTAKEKNNKIEKKQDVVRYTTLDKVDNIDDLKKLNKDELTNLAEDIRHFLVDNVSKTGGHLAPNLGVVELTIALHYVFNSPDDKIIFDVGHQCYVHKILTGRKKDFPTLRKLNGISGFPKTRESVHDIFNTGHSSTSISTALGIATANKLQGKKDFAIAVIGDGALTGGLAFEGLNNARIDDTNLIVILNDNQMSISPSVGNLSIYLNEIRSNSLYTNSKKKIKSTLERIPFIGNALIHLIENTKNALRHVLLPNSVMFEQFGFTYLGPIDGHNIQDLTKILERAKNVKKPVLLHVITTKGKGYKPAEDKPDIFHGIGKFDPESGKITNSSEMSYSKKLGDTLIDIAKKNEKIVAITAAMPKGTGLYEFSKEFPNRFFDVGIAEEHAVTFASGLATQGYIPFFAVYSTFLQRGYDEIIHDIALQNAHVILAIDRAGIVGSDGETHHGIYDLSYLSHIPNMTIMAPKDATEFSNMINFAIKYNAPIAIRYPRDGYVEKLGNKQDEIKLGKAEILLEGNDITIVALGKTVVTAIKVAEILKKKNITAEVINARFLKPLDTSTILNSLRKTQKIITIEDNVITGGLASAVENIIINEENIKLKKFFAYPDVFIKHGTTSEIEDEFGLTPEKISKEIVKNIQTRKTSNIKKLI